MYWMIWIAVVLVVIAAIVAFAGSRLPVAHRATRTATIALAPEALYALLSEVDRYPAWRKDVKTIERLPDRSGMPAWIEHTSSGTLPLAFERMERPSLLVARITDPGLPFGGTWTYRIAPVQDGSELSITEDGEIYNVIFRFMARFFFGYTATIDTYIRHLQAAVDVGVR